MANNESKFWREKDLVFKTSKRLNTVWHNQMQAILNVCSLPAFHSFIEDGYVTHFIDGTDLHGTPPFILDPSCSPCILTREERPAALQILQDIESVGQVLGFTFGDVTCGNILRRHSDGILFLIDFDSIVNYPPTKDVLCVWDNFRIMVQ
jgi:hypothetical protein